jgi:hypothetical protein
MRSLKSLPDNKARQFLDKLSELQEDIDIAGYEYTDYTGESINSADNSLHNKMYEMDDDVSVDMSVGSVRSAVSVSSIANSVSSRYSNMTSYGEPEKSPNAAASHIMRKIGNAMTPDIVSAISIKYDLNSRGGDLHGPAGVRAILASDIGIQLTTKEIDCLMAKFDIEKKGVVDISSILGQAKIYHNIVADEKFAKQYEKKFQKDKKQNLETREYYKKLKSEAPERDSQALVGILKIMRDAAFEAIIKKNMKPFQSCPMFMVQKEFHDLLDVLNVPLTTRQKCLLERRYFNKDKLIDTQAFKMEFTLLGRKLVIEEKKKEALHSFLGKLSEDDNEYGDRDYNNTTMTMLPKRHDVIVDGKKMSFQMSEEWLADPLVPRKKVEKPKINEPPLKSREKSREKSVESNSIIKVADEIDVLGPAATSLKMPPKSPVANASRSIGNGKLDYFISKDSTKPSEYSFEMEYKKSNVEDDDNVLNETLGNLSILDISKLDSSKVIRKDSKDSYDLDQTNESLISRSFADESQDNVLLEESFYDK